MATIISNQAIATYTYEGSTDSRTATSNVANTTLLDDYSLEVNKVNYQQCFRPGENVTYAIRVTNTGCKKLTDFIITDDLGTFDSEYPLSYMEGTARVSINGEFITVNPTDTTPLTFNIPNTLTSGETFTLTYVATVDSEIGAGLLEITNTATVSALSACDPSDTTRYTATDTATLPRCTDANLVITKQVSKSNICSCDAFDYIITVDNTGLVDATNVVITDQLPEGFNVTNIRVENPDTLHNYDTSEYELTEANFLTLPNETGRVINVRAIEPGVRNSTIITISGTFNAPDNNG